MLRQHQRLVYVLGRSIVGRREIMSSSKQMREMVEEEEVNDPRAEWSSGNAFTVPSQLLMTSAAASRSDVSSKPIAASTLSSQLAERSPSPTMPIATMIANAPPIYDVQSLPLQDATIVDVRPQNAFLEKHIKGSVSFDLATLGQGGGDDTRATELPSRSWPKILEVVGANDAEKAKGIEWLESKGWRVNHEKSFAADSLDWIQLEKEGKVERGRSLFRFWRASPPLERGCEHMAFVINANKAESADAKKWALDLGCGSGRDAVFLAQRGWNVVAVDREESFLSKVESFAAREGVAHLIKLRVADLRPHNINRVLGDILTEQRFDLIHMSRFMNRPLLGFLSHNVPKNSFFAIHHFLVGAQSRHGKPFKNGTEQTLQKGELARDWFHEPDFTILLDEESELADKRPVTNFVCRRN